MKTKLSTMSFLVEDAEKYGLNGAVFLYSLRFYLELNLNKGHNIKDGQVWSYDTHDSFLKRFSFWSKDQIRTVVKNLKKQGAIITGDFNSNRWRRAIWYSMPEYSTSEPCNSFDEFIANGDLPIGDGKNPNEGESTMGNNPTQIGNITNTTDGKIPISSTDDNLSNNLRQIMGPSDPVSSFPCLKKVQVSLRSVVVEILNYWSEVMDVKINLNNDSKINAKRAKLVSERLKEGEACLESSKRVIDACAASDWHMGRDPNAGGVYNDIEYIFTPERFEKWSKVKTRRRGAGTKSGLTVDEIYAKYLPDDGVEKDVTPKY